MVEVLTPILHRKSYFRTGSFEKKEEHSDTGGKTEENKADENNESTATANVVPTIVVTSPSSNKVTSPVAIELNTLTEEDEQDC